MKYKGIFGVMTDLKAMYLMKYCLLFIVPNLVTGQQYNLTGSSEFAYLGEAFTWTCGMFVPHGQTVNAVQFSRNKLVIAALGYNGSYCHIQSQISRYTYRCLSNSLYTLTIPPGNMTEYEQNTSWKCIYVLNNSYKSPDVPLRIRINVYNISLSPNDNPLTIREVEQREVSCVVNTNAFPVPTIKWFLRSTDSTNTMRNDTKAVISYITITGNRTDNTKTVECRATNNDRPAKIASTILNVEYPPTVNTLSEKTIIEERTLMVTCRAEPGNPNSLTFYWTKVGNPGFKQNGKSLQFSNIQRTNSGTYQCTAENNYSNGRKGIHSQFMDVNVYYPPTVNVLSQQNIIEGKPLSVNCNATPGNPNSTTFYWTKVGNLGFRQNRATLQLQNIQRNNSGTYQCTAENNYGGGEIGTHSQLMVVNVYYSPMVDKLSQQDIIEGNPLSVNCNATPGNPNSTTFYWTKVGNSGFRQNGTTLQLQNIQRNNSGTYQCTAENKFNNKEIGSHSQFMVVNVLYPPTVNVLSQQNIIEGKPLSVNCKATPGNPNSTTFYWTKVGDSGFRQNRTTLQLNNIQRTSSGTYQCTAENNYSDREKGSDSQSMNINVYYPPTVYSLSQQDIVEGRGVNVTCTARLGNPNSTTFYWTKVGDSGFRHNGPTLQFPNVHRNSSGTYNCTAENNYSIEEKGTHNQSMVVNVLYTPAIEKKPSLIVNESEKVVLTREIDGNPLSNVNWFKGKELLKIQTLVSIATYTIEEATCKDTWNFTLTANNEIGSMVTTCVELIVNCKPMIDKTNITLGVTDTTGIDLSVSILAYPQPQYAMEYANGTRNTQMMDTIIRNSVNNFTINFNQTTVKQADYGTYYLRVSNLFGETTVVVNVQPQRKPNMPILSEVVCEVTQAIVKWKSTFNGGDVQLFTAIAFTGFYKESDSGPIADKGENEIHSATVQNLKPSTKYVFYVSANNSHGESSSKNISCKTVEENSVNLQLVAGGAAAGGISLAIIIIVIVILLRKYTMNEKQTGNSQRFKNEVAENEEVNDDGMRDNILYVSAGPKMDEKAEGAVYASVNKNAPESNNNANVYAEVNKSGHKNAEGALYSDVKPKRGFFKKDGKVKKEKRQKRKQEVADVYENSDDIAMTANPDNVYSNTNHKNDSAKKEQRGYKNKDGLLYVEVQFDTKTEERNPVIHGDDEKTDYATVEFPVPSSSHDRE